jgi:hypothetical protein
MTRLAAIAVKRGWDSAVTTLPSNLSPRNSRFVAASLLEGARFELLLPIRKAVPFGDRELSRRRQKAFRNGDHRMWDREFESGSLQPRVSCEPAFIRPRPAAARPTPVKIGGGEGSDRDTGILELSPKIDREPDLSQLLWQ